MPMDWVFVMKWAKSVLGCALYIVHLFAIFVENMFIFRGFGCLIVKGGLEITLSLDISNS